MISVHYILTFLPTYINRETVELTRRGVKVDILLPLPIRPPSQWHTITGIKGSHYRNPRVREIMPYKWLNHSEEQLEEALPRSVLNFVDQHARARMMAKRCTQEGDLNYFWVAVSLALMLKRERVQRIHAHFAKDGAQIGLLTAELLEVPFTLTTHAKDIFAPLQVNRLHRLLRRTSQIFTISRFNKLYLENLTGKAISSRIQLTRMGINLASLPGRRPQRHNELPHVVSVASGLVEKKGVSCLIEALEILESRGIAFRCTIAGSDQEGTELARLQRQVSQSRLATRLDLLGTVPHAELMRIMAGADVFVHPSVPAHNGDMDGIPVSLIEAMGIGLPVVSTTVSGIPELLENHVTGLLIPPGDAVALAGAIFSLVARPAFAAALASRAQLKVKEDFSLSTHVDRMLTYWRIIESRGSLQENRDPDNDRSELGTW